MRSFFGGQQKQTPQTILKELLHNVSQSQTTKISPQQIGYFMKYTQNIDLAGELVLALTDHIDQHANEPADVLKTLQILFFCLSKAHDTVLPAAQAFAPEIATIFLLSFEKSNCTLRDAVHLLTRTIYNHLIRNEPLPSLESYGLNFDVQSPPPAESRQQRPSNRAPPLGRSNKQGQQPFHNHPEPHRQQTSEDLFDWKDNEDAGNGDKFGEMQSFDTKPSAPKPKSEMNLPEKDRPRAPAAFAAFANGGHIAASNLPRGDDTLINWEDNEPEDEAAPKKDPVQDVFGDVQFGSFETQDTKSNEPDLFDFSNAQPKGTKSSSNQDIFDPFEGGFQNSSEQLNQDENDFLGNQDDDGQTFDPFSGGEDVFDPFAGQQPQEQQKPAARKTITSQDTTDPLPKSLPSSTNASQNGTFDPFGDLTSQGTDSTKPKPPSGDGFDPFAGMTNSAKTTAKPPSNDTFDPFAGASKPTSSNNNFDAFTKSSNPGTAKQPSNDTFDPFASSVPSKQPQSSKDIMDMLSAPSPKVNDDTFDPFAGNSKPVQSNAPQGIDSTKPKPPSGDGFDPFAGMTNSAKTTTKPPSNDTFDPFAGSSKPEPAKQASNDTFDPFAGSSKPEPVKTTVKPPSNDTFDPFAGASKPTSSNNNFDAFTKSSNPGTAKQPSNDTFDPFASSVPSKQPQSSKDIMDMLSAPSPKVNDDTFDPFAGNSKPVQSNAPQGIDSTKPKPPSGDGFDPFAGMTNSAKTTTKPPSNDTFDPFAGSSKPEPAKQASNDTFDPFAGSSKPEPVKTTVKPPSNDTFDPFAGASKPTSSNNNFDAFTKSSNPGTAKQPSNDTFDPFASSVPSKQPQSSKDIMDMLSAPSPKVNDDTFDPFAGNSKPVQSNAPQGIDSTKPKPPSGDGFDPFAGMTNSAKTTTKPPSNDTFDPFAGSSKPEPAKPKPTASNNAFDAFSSPSKSPSKPTTNDTFDPFAGVQQQKPARKQASSNAFDMFGSASPSPAASNKASQNTFDMFGSSSSTQQKPKPSNDVFDPFAGMQQQQKPQPQQQQSLKSKFAAQPQQQQQKPQQKLLGAGPSQQNQGSKGSDVFDMLGF